LRAAWLQAKLRYENSPTAENSALLKETYDNYIVGLTAILQ
jgi:hypothetical protein